MTAVAASGTHRRQPPEALLTAEALAHRPWPLPSGPWVMRQTWLDLLFAHWPVPAAVIRPLVPEVLELDLYEGQAWLGVVPFRMEAVRWRWLPPIPTTAAFPELNVRTYVTHGGKPGVWFFSLDAASTLAVRAARAAFGLPYFHARMASRPDGAAVRYASRRTHRGAPPAAFRADYGPTGPAATAAPGSLEDWLTARYCLYSYRRRLKTLLRAEIHHLPWPLQPAAAELHVNSMGAAAGVPLSGPPLLHFARGLDVLVWPVRGAGPERDRDR